MSVETKKNETAEKLNIYQRINNIKKEVTYVQKDKHVTGGGQNYKAVTHDQVVSVARQSMVDNGVLCIPSQIDGEITIMRDIKNDIKMHLYSGKYEVSFINEDDPSDKITISIHAQAADNGDKAPGKAITYATKSALLKVLQLETGEDDESRAESRATITDDQTKKLEDKLKGNESIKNKMLRAYKIDAISELNPSKFDECEKRLDAALEAAKNAGN